MSSCSPIFFLHAARRETALGRPVSDRRSGLLAPDRSAEDCASGSAPPRLPLHSLRANSQPLFPAEQRTCPRSPSACSPSCTQEEDECCRLPFGLLSVGDSRLNSSLKRQSGAGTIIGRLILLRSN